jgi:cytochrome d ubiquinol oxidase subunit II
VVASFVPSLLWGVAFANIARGVPLERSSQGFIEYTGGFFNLLNPFAIVGGLVTLTLFATHGAFFIALKTEGTVRDRANQLAGRLGLATALLAVVFLGWLSLSYSDKSSVVVLSAVIVVAWLSALEANRRGREGWAFLYSAATSAMVVITLFTALYPYVMPSSVSPEFSLDIFNASSTNYTLKVMTYVAVVMTPLVLLYQAWTYWVFRKRISPSQIHNAESGVLDKINN